MKVGIDIIELDRIDNSDKFINSIFTENEKKYFKKFNNTKERIAGFFSAKEACYKALDIKEACIRDIEISHEESGRPIIILQGKTKALFEEKYPEGKVDISISHSKTIATAICIVF